MSYSRYWHKNQIIKKTKDYPYYEYDFQNFIPQANFIAECSVQTPKSFGKESED